MQRKSLNRLINKDYYVSVWVPIITEQLPGCSWSQTSLLGAPGYRIYHRVCLITEQLPGCSWLQTSLLGAPGYRIYHRVCLITEQIHRGPWSQNSLLQGPVHNRSSGPPDHRIHWVPLIIDQVTEASWIHHKTMPSQYLKFEINITCQLWPCGYHKTNGSVVYMAKVFCYQMLLELKQSVTREACRILWNICVANFSVCITAIKFMKKHY